MATLPLNEPAGVLVKTTCVDFPGIVAGSFFLKGCNLRCPYCYNIELIKGKTQDLNTIQDLFAHMEKRQGILKGIVISGGEPLINPYTPIIIKKAKELVKEAKKESFIDNDFKDANVHFSLLNITDGNYRWNQINLYAEYKNKNIPKKSLYMSSKYNLFPIFPPYRNKSTTMLLFIIFQHLFLTFCLLILSST